MKQGAGTEQAEALNELGGLYSSIGNHKKALESFKEAKVLTDGQTNDSALLGELSHFKDALKCLETDLDNPALDAFQKELQSLQSFSSPTEDLIQKWHHRFPDDLRFFDLEPEYAIRTARIEELPQLATIEQAAAIRFRDTPYAFLADGEPLSFEFVQQRFQAGQVWVAVDRDDIVIGFAITHEIDGTLCLQEIDVAPEHGQRGIGKALVRTLQTWGSQSGYSVMSLSTFRDLPWNGPFYAKLGFCIIDEGKLSPGFQQIQAHEQEAGLPIANRVIMQCDL